MKIYHSIQDMVGQTPILQLHHIEKLEETQAHLFAKLEYYNPAGSVKDRVAKRMLLDALEAGQIHLDSTIIEPTSGNTGIGLCAIGSALGLKVIIVMPDTMSEERRKLMKAYGAKLVLTPGKEGMSGAIAKAEALAKVAGDEVSFKDRALELAGMAVGTLAFWGLGGWILGGAAKVTGTGANILSKLGLVKNAASGATTLTTGAKLASAAIGAGAVATEAVALTKTSGIVE